MGLQTELNLMCTVEGGAHCAAILGLQERCLVELQHLLPDCADRVANSGTHTQAVAGAHTLPHRKTNGCTFESTYHANL
jgi:hypothetical protein